MISINIIEASRLLSEVRELKSEGCRFVHMCETADENGAAQIVYFFDRGGQLETFRTDVPEIKKIESITPDYPAASIFEKEIAESAGVEFIHSAKGALAHAERDAKGRLPFGPQNPLIAEPVLFDLGVSEGKITDAVPVTGFMYKGAEKLAEAGGCGKAAVIMERICGSSSFGHSWGICAAIEAAKNIRLPERALYLRTILMEMSRIQSHINMLAETADAAGFESAAAHFWTVRERVLDLLEEMTGGRIIHSICRPGGLRRDIDNGLIEAAAEEIAEIKDEVSRLAEIFLEDASVLDRLAGTGYADREMLLSLSAAGPVIRGSGIVQDARTEDRLGVYGQLSFEPAVEEAGDCAARCRVRVKEILQSADMIAEAAGKLPSGAVCIDNHGSENGEAAVRLELADGEAVYYVKCSGFGGISKVSVRTATRMNLAAVTEILRGCEIEDAAPVIKSADLKISGMER